MFGKGRKKRRNTRIDSLIGKGTECFGDVSFDHGLHIDGSVRGDVRARQEDAILTLGKGGRIEGEVRVAHIILNGEVLGDVYASHRIELDAAARVTGNVYYQQIEMAMGAEVNGKLIRHGSGSQEETRPVIRVAESVASKY